MTAASGARAADAHLRSDPEPGRRRAGRCPGARGRAAQGARAEIPARSHRRRPRRSTALARRIPISSRRWAAPTTPSSYGGRVHLFVTGPAGDAGDSGAGSCRANTRATTARRSPRSFRRFSGDFYAIDPMLFSPAEVIVTAIDSGESFHAGPRRSEAARCLVRLTRSRSSRRTALRSWRSSSTARDWHAPRCRRRSPHAGCVRSRSACSVWHRDHEHVRARHRRVRRAPARRRARALDVRRHFEAVTRRLGILHALRENGVRSGTMRRAIERCVDKSMTTFLLARAGLPTPADLGGRMRTRPRKRSCGARARRAAGAEAAVRLAGARPEADPDSGRAAPRGGGGGRLLPAAFVGDRGQRRLPRFPPLRHRAAVSSPPWRGTPPAGSPM